MVELNNQFSQASVLQVRALIPINGSVHCFVGQLLCGEAMRGAVKQPSISGKL
jgi:hypothetical protein